MFQFGHLVHPNRLKTKAIDMEKSATVVAGVVYPGCERFLEDYYESLRTQTDQSFDLLLINDHVDRGAKKMFSTDTIWIDLNESLSPANIRKLVLETAIKLGYSEIIFTDTDDYYSTNRVSDSKKLLKKHDFVFNEISVVDESGILLGENYLANNIKINSLTNFTQIIDRNIVGFTNSAINLQSLGDIPIPSDIIAVDWWLFTILLLKGLSGAFSSASVSLYRQHESNLVGFSKPLTLEGLRRGVAVKRRHYSALLDYARQSGLNDVSKVVGAKLDEILCLSESINDNNFCERYMSEVNSRRELYSGWWHEIVPAFKDDIK